MVAPARSSHPPSGHLVQRVAPGALAAERTISVHPALATLLPQGLARGTSVVCLGAAAMSTALLLSAVASQAEAWVGVAGVPTFGAQACHEMGTVLERVVVVRAVDHGGGGRDDMWAPILGSMVDGFDIIVFGAAAQTRPATARRVQARLQARGGVLLLVGDAGPFSTDVRLTTTATWQGLGQGAGHLRQRTVEVVVDGRRVPQARRDHLAMPGAAGEICSLTAPPTDGRPSVEADRGALVPLRRTG